MPTSKNLNSSVVPPPGTAGQQEQVPLERQQTNNFQEKENVGQQQQEQSSFLGSNSINPCEPSSKKKCTDKKIRKHPLGDARQDKYRVRLNMEKQDFQNEYIEYNVEAPNRVAIRMEYLMGTTKVNLNDKAYLSKLLSCLEKEEEIELKKATHERELKEKHRVKKLVIEGEMPPPPDLQHLYHHPVFRVNAMLRRLEQHDTLLTTVPKPDTKLIPCEPYEYNGNNFFKHLHKYGTPDYIPREIRLARKLKLQGKIQRARERLAENQNEKAQLEATLKLIYVKPHTCVSESTNPTSSVFETGDETNSGDSGKRSNESLSETLKRKSESKKKRQEMIERAEQDKNEQEMILLFQKRERELERMRFDRRQEADELQRKQRLENEMIRNEQDTKYQKMLKEKAKRRAELDPDLLAILDKLSLTDMLTPSKPNVNETDSQKYFRQEYEISPKTNLQIYEPRTNIIMKNYHNESQNVHDLFQHSNDIKQVFDREQLVCEEFLKKINRPQTMQKKL